MSRAERASSEAADWLIAQDDGPLLPEDQAAFDAWLAASEGNKAAYWRLESAWQEADRVCALGRGTAVPLLGQDFAQPRRKWLPAALAASVALIAGSWLLSPYWQVFAPRSGKPAAVATHSYATSVGMMKFVGLQDGSRIQLNSQSTVRTQITTGRRQVWLDKGEAFFEVAHRREQPFVVHAGDRLITVLGTKFSVRRDGEKVVVIVLEGRVRVDELKDNQLLRSSVIAGGKIAMAEGAATLVTDRSQEKVDDALSWRSGMLSFDQKPLPAIAAEFNRYNVKKMVLASPSLESIRITGTFPADQPDAFARLLRDAYGFEIAETAGEIQVSE